MKKFWLMVCLLGLMFKLNAQPVPYPYPKTLTVAQDGSGNYKTIQEAVNAVRDLSQEKVIINIKKGIYHEKLVIPSWKINISLAGEDRENTIISNNNYSGQNLPNGKDASGRTQFNTYTSYTVLVQGRDFSAENLTIENTAGRVGQAVALHVEGDRCSLKNCKLLGNQDTLYAGVESSRQFYQDCMIAGTTDFIFGEATVVFLHCTIKSLANSFITAASTTPRQKFGFVFLSCTLMASAATKVYLGRPWRPFANTVFIGTKMGSQILPAGWDPWVNPAKVDNTKTAFYAEYQSSGLGGNVKERVKWSHQLTAHQAEVYTIKNIFAGKDGWNPLKN
ncbi:MAG: pectin esterase [Sphingobacteriaceae bacterium]|nr:MAG: pectin esterase [Sphingobacteriaceae bacterium]